MVVIEDIYKVIGGLRKVFMGIAGQYVKSEYKMEDAVQELFVIFLQMNPDTLKRIYEQDGKKGLIRYGATTLRRNFTSNKNTYYYKYRRYYTLFPSQYFYNENYYGKMDMDSKDSNNTWQYFEKMDMELDKLYWYDRELYKLYYNVEGETLDTIAKKTGISRNSLFTTIDNVRKHLKKVLKDE